MQADRDRGGSAPSVMALKVNGKRTKHIDQRDGERIMKATRRTFILGAAATAAAAASGRLAQAADPVFASAGRRFRYAHVDVFTSRPLAGNPLDVFLDARGLSDADMLAITRETFLSEATFVFPRDAATERDHGIRVRIFTPQGEVPFAGHPTLGTAMVLRHLRGMTRRPGGRPAVGPEQITLDLNVGQVPVTFTQDDSGQVFGEMRQVAPQFGALHDRATVAMLHHLTLDDIDDYAPIQTVSTGLPFAIVPLRRLSTLQSLRIDTDRMNAYTAGQEANFGFYYVTRDTQDADVALRTRCVYVGGEDAATGSAAGCTAGWLVRHGAVAPEQSVHIRQGVEMNRPSDLYVRASRDGERIVNVRVGGHAVQTMAGELVL